MEVIQELRALPQRFPVNEASELARALDEAAPELDRGYGSGAAHVIRSLTVNVGRMSGGIKVNMIPAECEFDADIRVPNGVDAEAVKAEVASIVARHGAQMEVLTFTPPNWREPYHEMMDHVRANATLIKPGLVPARVVSPGATDARLWRINGVPAVVYGPSPHGMGSVDEYVSVDEFLHVVKAHVLSAFDFLGPKD
jgi:succinyl-diaminopimelate desuccinylase